MPTSDFAWIAGAGVFGTKAAQTLLKGHEPDTILALDQDTSALAPLSDLKVRTITAEATDFLVKHLHTPDSPKWIIPCVPYHLAWEWLLKRLGPRAEPVSVPETFSLGWPHPWPTQKGGYTVSYADFICPPDCPEPKDICTHTGRPRPGLLYQELENMKIPGYRTLVLQSRQLAPGLGGYRSGALLDLEQQILLLKGNLLLATACKCHGVINALKIF